MIQATTGLAVVTMDRPRGMSFGGWVAKRQRIERRPSPEPFVGPEELPPARPFGPIAPIEALATNAPFAFGQIPVLARETVVPRDGALIAKAEKSFGTPLGDVRMHTNDGIAEARGAAAIATGRDIHFASATVHPQHGPEPTLAAHELGHVVQQATPPGRPGSGSLEREAEAGSRAVGEGRPFHGFSGAGSLVLAKGFLEWFAENTFWAQQVYVSSFARRGPAVFVR
jgi:hypothetical protein